MVSRINLERAYQGPTDSTGYRVLVDRVWPRGVKRETLRLDEWSRDVAPTTELRRWYGHRLDRWPEFRERYRSELMQGAQARAFAALLEHARQGPLTLVFGAKDADHSQARVLQELLEERLGSDQGD
ncbi:MAG: DUF488 family protein [Dehalococcoidia bacterium]|nr:DUF488 family protein [Dehalococcoidia bacterium]MCB9486388.1 DUF488 family protein [Thermoflexaceae bacterium]